MNKKYLITGIFIIILMLNVNAIIPIMNSYGSEERKLRNINLMTNNLTNTTCIFFNNNEILCGNETVIDTNLYLIWNSTSKYIVNSTGYLDLNETILNNTIILFSGENDTVWNITNSKYIVNYSNIIDVNETILNNTIDLFLLSYLYNASEINTIEGTLNAGDINSIHVLGDDDIYNVTEDNGINPLIINVSFNNILDFSNIYLSFFYNGGSGHEIELELWDFINEEWIEKYEITDTDSYNTINIPILDSSNYIDSEIVYMRFNHLQNGINLSLIHI